MPNLISYQKTCRILLPSYDVFTFSSKLVAVWPKKTRKRQIGDGFYGRSFPGRKVKHGLEDGW